MGYLIDYSCPGLFGAAAGDMCGSEWEFAKNEDGTRKKAERGLKLVPGRFTDDTVCTAAVAEWILDGSLTVGDLENKLVAWCREYLGKVGYGPKFKEWFQTDQEIRKPYGSWGNGAAMRVSPVGWWADSEQDAMQLAEMSCMPTHNSDQAIRAAKAVAVAIFLMKSGWDRGDVIAKIKADYYPDLLTMPLVMKQKDYRFEVSCDKSVPESIECWLNAFCFDDVLRNAIWMGGDTDTMACIAGSIAAADRSTPMSRELLEKTWTKLDFSIREKFAEFNLLYCQGRPCMPEIKQAGLL